MPDMHSVFSVLQWRRVSRGILYYQVTTVMFCIAISTRLPVNATIIIMMNVAVRTSVFHEQIKLLAKSLHFYYVCVCY